MRTHKVAHLALPIALSVTGCTQPSGTNAQREKAPKAAAPDTRAGLPKRVEPIRLPCAGKGYTASYSAQTQSAPAMVDVTFRGVAPTSSAAQRALERCLQVAADTKFIAAEVLGTAWYSKSGQESDDDAVSLRDGSSHLVYLPDSKRIITWNQRQGEQSSIAENVAAGYFVKKEVNRILVAPGGTFVHLSVVFKSEPTEKTAFEVLMAEVRKAVAQQTSPVATTGYAQVGRRENPAAWRQVRGSDGHFILVEFDPKRGDQLVSSTGRSLGDIHAR